MLVGTRGIEPPFSPWAALTSKERLAPRHTRSRRVFPYCARLSGPPDRENHLLIDCHNRNRRRVACGASFRTSYNPSVCSAKQCPRNIGGSSWNRTTFTGWHTPSPSLLSLIWFSCGTSTVHNCQGMPVFPGCHGSCSVIRGNRPFSSVARTIAKQGCTSARQ